MRTTVLFFTAMLMSLTSVSAFEANHHKPKHRKHVSETFRYAQPILFIERGVEFLIFPDGSFDFNTDTYRDFYNNRPNWNSRRGVSTTYGAPNSPYQRNRGVFIAHDRNGKVRRIGNVYLNYDRFGRIKRAGAVYMNYAFGRPQAALIQVGGLRVNYNRWGEIVNTHGQVNRVRGYCNLNGFGNATTGPQFGNRNSQYDDERWFNNREGNRYEDDDRWFDNRDDDRFEDDGIYQNDDNYYYYKQNGKVMKHKKNRW
ncbi:hypothetical protein [Hyunsoonleella rubra]|uniref:WG repeat-containing protein n=1 Tax=Hyunsoonleella rubra TaxID=1737062 RepID=A0ABW5T9V1_9FLAO